MTSTLMSPNQKQTLDAYAIGRQDVSWIKDRKKAITGPGSVPEDQDYDEASLITEIDLSEGEPESTQYIPVLVNRLLGDYMKHPLQVSFKAIDALSRNEKREAELYLANKDRMQGIVNALSAYSGLNPPTVSHPKTKQLTSEFKDNRDLGQQFQDLNLNPNNEVELKIGVDMTIKSHVVVALELIWEHISELNNLDAIRVMMFKKAIKYRYIALRSYISQKTGMPTIEFLDPAEVGVHKSEYPMYDDSPIRWIKKKYSLLNLMDHIDLSDSEIEDIFEKNMADYGFRGYYSKLPEEIQAGAVNLCCENLKQEHMAQMEIAVTYVETLSSDKTNREGIGKYRSTIYSWYHIQNSDQRVFGFEEMKSTAWDDSGKPIFSIHIAKVEETSIIERLIHVVNEFDITNHKKRKEIESSLPSGMIYNINALESAAEALGVDVIEILRHGLRENDWPSVNADADGQHQNQTRTHHRLEGGMTSAFSHFKNHTYDLKRDMGELAGISESRLSHTGKDTAVGIQRLKQDASIQTTHYLWYWIDAFMERLVTGIAYQIQRIVNDKKNPARKKLEQIIGNKGFPIETLDEIGLREFGIYSCVTANEELKAYMKIYFEELITKGVINPIEAQILLEHRSLSRVAQILSYYLEIHNKREAAAAAAQAETEGRTPVAVAQIQAQSKLQGIEMKSQLDGQNEMAVEQLRQQNENARAIKKGYDRQRSGRDLTQNRINQKKAEALINKLVEEGFSNYLDLANDPAALDKIFQNGRSSSSSRESQETVGESAGAKGS